MNKKTLKERVAKYAINYRDSVPKKTPKDEKKDIDDAFNRIHVSYGTVIASLVEGLKTANKMVKEKKRLNPELYALEILGLEEDIQRISRNIQINKYNRTLLSADKKTMKASIKELLFVIDIIKSLDENDIKDITEGYSFSTKEEFMDILIKEELINTKKFHEEVFNLAELSARTIITEIAKVEDRFIEQYPEKNEEYFRVKALKGFKDIEEAHKFIEVFKNVKPRAMKGDDTAKFDIITENLANAVNVIRGVKGLTDLLGQVAGENNATEELMASIVKTNEEKHIKTLKAIIKIGDAIYGENINATIVIGIVTIIYGIYGVELAPSKVAQILKLI